ncbi:MULTISPECIES: N-acetylglucosamine-6-phosphate deacetylase [Rhodococcus]|uniref:N-acetylglucosamine-6-phosphate deacetylase n=1 Tax=Rhodococcus TaxID=1827 RepID=UPI0006BA30A5|nr:MULTISPECIES: amidohydrolase family protein [Rhodococcus]KPH17901.1 N-acetylglucosamine-6-phosphate deacetylase [Rhodococcus sp. ADH]
MHRGQILRGQLVTGGQLLPDGVVEISGDRVVWAGPASQRTDPLPERAAAGTTIIPGLVDVHCHGAGGFGFPEADEFGSTVAADHHRTNGTTSVIGSLVSAPPQILRSRIELLAGLVDEGTLAGIHLEGPFLSVLRCGAQDPDSILDGDPALLESLLEAGRGHIRSMTIAPETAHFGEIASLLERHRAVVSIGHTDASNPIATRSIAHSAHAPLSATHLFNGMAPMHHRAPGAVAACLAAAAKGQMVVELIGDGVHLADETVATVFDLVGPHQIALVSDAMAAAGMPDGRYPLGPLDVDVIDGVARLAGQGETAIAGGTSRLMDIVRRAVNHAGVDLLSAVIAATATPASLMGLAGMVGDLVPGCRADLIVTGPELETRAVMAAGNWLMNYTES